MPSVARRLGFDDRLEIGALRHELDGEGPADQFHPGIGQLPTVLELVAIAALFKNRDDIRNRDPLEMLQPVVGHDRAAVVRAGEWTFFGITEKLGLTEAAHLTR